MGFSPHQASLPHWPKIRTPALSSIDCLPSDQQKTHLLVPLALVGHQQLLLLLGKPDGPIWHFGLSGFPIRKAKAELTWVASNGSGCLSD
jgi:hypothetical protein